jgi:predicted nucleotidyltransferase
VLHAHLPQRHEEYGVANLWLFGSYVRGDRHKRSDLDVLVEFEEVPTLPKFISLERKLCEITGIKVDLVSIHSLKGEISKRIQREKVSL